MNREQIEKLENALKEIFGAGVVKEEKIDMSAEISAKTLDNGTVACHVEGTGKAILVLLAGIEKNILENLDVSAEDWEEIKSNTSVREAK